MRFKFFPLLILFLATKSCFSQTCQGYEQRAFNYFVDTLVRKNEYLKHKKFIFCDTIINQYSKFAFSEIVLSSEKKSKLEKAFLDSVLNASYYAEKYNKDQSSCHIIQLEGLPKLFVKKKAKSRLLLQVFKATRVENYYYVQIRYISSEHRVDYILELDDKKDIKRWFVQSVVF